MVSPTACSTWVVACAAGFVLCSCTRTEEVLTRRSSPAAPATQSERPLDAGAPTGGSETGPSPSSEPATSERPSHSSDAPSVSTSDPGSSAPGSLLAANPLVVGTGFETTCLAFNQDGLSVLGCMGALSLEPRIQSVAQGETLVKFVAFDGGEGHMCVLDDSGAVSCWGRNSSGQLGAGSREPNDGLASVGLPEPVVSLSSGGSHVCAITTSGQLYCWGLNSEGQLGLGDDPTSDDEGSSFSSPMLVDGGPWRSVSAGFTHTCGVRVDGSLWCWGRNTQFQVASNGEPQVRSPAQVDDQYTWSQVAAGQSHTCALRADGTLWCWGSDASAEADYPLGADADWQWQSPRQVGDRTWKTLATRSFHTCVISPENELWCWGRNEEGQLGTGNRETQSNVTRVLEGALQVSLGQFHTCVVSEADVRCTGSNEFGQLGLVDDAGQDQFTSVADQLRDLLMFRLDP